MQMRAARNSTTRSRSKVQDVYRNFIFLLIVSFFMGSWAASRIQSRICLAIPAMLLLDVLHATSQGQPLQGPNSIEQI